MVLGLPARSEQLRLVLWGHWHAHPRAARYAVLAGRQVY